MLAGSGVNVTSEGCPYLGAAIGTTTYIQNAVSKKVPVWSEDLKWLSKMAETHSHAAYCTFALGILSRWLFICRTVLGIFPSVDNVICQVFIPTTTGRSPPSELMHKLFSLLAHWGGLGLPEPSALCDTEFAASLNICEALCNFIADRFLHFARVSSAQPHRKSLIGKSEAEMHSFLSSSLCENFDASLQCAVDFASVKGASI